MYYLKKKRTPLFTEKTYAEKLTGIMDLKQEPTKKQVKRFYIMVFLGAFFLLLNTSQVCAYEPTISPIKAWDGAGEKWTCGNCGTENYKWQGSCSNCGQSQ